MMMLTNTYVCRGCDDHKNEDTVEHLTTNSFIVIITKILWTKKHSTLYGLRVDVVMVISIIMVLV